MRANLNLIVDQDRGERYPNRCSNTSEGGPDPVRDHAGPPSDGASGVTRRSPGTGRTSPAGERQNITTRGRRGRAEREPGHTYGPRHEGRHGRERGPLNPGCATKKRDFAEPWRLEPQENAEKRRRRLSVGIDRWIRDVRNDGEPISRVHLVALTVAAADPWRAEGAVRRLFQDLRSEFRSTRKNPRLGSVADKGTRGKLSSGATRAPVRSDSTTRVAAGQRSVITGGGRLPPAARGTSLRSSQSQAVAQDGCPRVHQTLASGSGNLGGRFRYFWWAEFQERGAIHFHMIWVDPPFRTVRQSRNWLRRHWSLARIHPDVRKRTPEWFTESAGAYVGSYAKKDGPKKYQQSFELMPKGWHTFACQRLAFPVAVHREHEPRLHTVNLAEPFAPWYQRLGNTWAIAADYHVPAPGGCRLDASQNRRKRQPRVTEAATTMAEARSLSVPTGIVTVCQDLSERSEQAQLDITFMTRARQHETALLGSKPDLKKKLPRLPTRKVRGRGSSQKEDRLCQSTSIS